MKSEVGSVCTSGRPQPHLALAERAPDAAAVRGDGGGGGGRHPGPRQTGRHRHVGSRATSNECIGRARRREGEHVVGKRRVCAQHERPPSLCARDATTDAAYDGGHCVAQTKMAASEP